MSQESLRYNQTNLVLAQCVSQGIMSPTEYVEAIRQLNVGLSHFGEAEVQNRNVNHQRPIQ